MFTKLVSLISWLFSSEKKTDTQAIVTTIPIVTNIPELPEMPAPTVPYESEVMKKIVAVLVEKGLAIIPHGMLSPQSRYYELYDVVVPMFGEKLEDVVAFCEDHGANRNSLEYEVHKKIVQIAIAYATKLHTGNTLTIKGNFGLVGMIYGSLVIDGNVDIVAGNVSPYLQITGNVKHLSIGPLWRQEPMKGQSCFLQILGDLDGYKTNINNPELEIEIRGNVTTKWAFLYETNIFKKMTICGDLLTEDSICPGFYEGELVVCGEAPHLKWYLNNNYKNTSAGDYARRNYRNPDFKGNQIFVGTHQLTKHSVTPQIMNLLERIYVDFAPCPWK